ncbi:hypothetical protein GWG54_19345 [Natronococcus sp. JC468]|uniref:hypothetical protein n=1 Tax=Natronococcus sp. JC468 TaxID=1961921 RepID=UPI0014394B09|nr:hypothetical protein [Natronococcus sp. JC468]NKE37910.1 hypothetical protein [Natronococcus sp. JC468]
MREPGDDFDDVEFAEQEVHEIIQDGYEEELEEIVHFYHAEQIRNLAKEMGRIADALEAQNE